MPCKVGEEQAQQDEGCSHQKPVPFTELQMREVLDGALHKRHEAELRKLEWNVLEENCDATVSKVESLEREIQTKMSQDSELKALSSGFSPSDKWCQG